VAKRTSAAATTVVFAARQVEAAGDMRHRTPVLVSLLGGLSLALLAAAVSAQNAPPQQLNEPAPLESMPGPPPQPNAWSSVCRTDKGWCAAWFSAAVPYGTDCACKGGLKGKTEPP
jgi:hypothetical protein